MKQFQVDHFYLANESSFGGVTVERRTNRTIFVVNHNGVRFRMRIKVDENGNEYAVDSSVPAKWRMAFSYYADREG